MDTLIDPRGPNELRPGGVAVDANPGKRTQQHNRRLDERGGGPRERLGSPLVGQIMRTAATKSDRHRKVLGDYTEGKTEPW